jgi:hypothetical protein
MSSENASEKKVPEEKEIDFELHTFHTGPLSKFLKSTADVSGKHFDQLIKIQSYELNGTTKQQLQVFVMNKTLWCGRSTMPGEMFNRFVTSERETVICVPALAIPHLNKVLSGCQELTILKYKDDAVVTFKTVKTVVDKDDDGKESETNARVIKDIETETNIRLITVNSNNFDVDPAIAIRDALELASKSWITVPVDIRRMHAQFKEICVDQKQGSTIIEFCQNHYVMFHRPPNDHDNSAWNRCKVPYRACKAKSIAVQLPNSLLSPLLEISKSVAKVKFMVDPVSADGILIAYEIDSGKAVKAKKVGDEIVHQTCPSASFVWAIATSSDAIDIPGRPQIIVEAANDSGDDSDGIN